MFDLNAGITAQMKYELKLNTLKVIDVGMENGLQILAILLKSEAL